MEKGPEKERVREEEPEGETERGGDRKRRGPGNVDKKNYEYAHL